MIGTNSFQVAPSGTAWTYSHESAYFCNGSSPFHDAAESGNQYAVIQSCGTSGQSLGTLTGLTQGSAYDLSFYLGSRSRYPIIAINVFVDGTPIAAGVEPADTRSGTDWTQFVLSFVAPASTTSVSFSGSYEPSGDDVNTAIDNISVTPQTVPEPASLAALGVGALGLLKRRRK